jgi:molecular chaperone GrpE
MKKVQKKDLDSEVILELKGQLARALADYDNLRKRVEKEREDLRKILAVSIILKFISILDGLKLAQKHLKDGGIAITIKEFEDILRGEGIEKIKIEVGDKFDEDVHEVTEVVEDSEKDGIIAEEVLEGWKFQDQNIQPGQIILRHAKVKVYKKVIERKQNE